MPPKPTVDVAKQVRDCKAIWAAVEAGDHEGLARFFMLERASPNFKIKGKSPLTRAFELGLSAVVTILFRAGAQGTPEQALYDAVARADLTMMRTLLDGGANVNALVGIDNSTTLHLCAHHPGSTHIDAAKLLLERGAAVDAVNADGDTPLIMAATWGSAPMAALLLAHKADTRARDKGPRMTALHWACDRLHVDVLAALLAAKADPNARDGKGATPLQYSGASKVPAIAQKLLAAGADPNLRANAGHTALAGWADKAGAGAVAAAKHLLACKGDVDLGLPNGSTPLILACQWANLDMVRLLLANKANIEAKTREVDLTPLLWASKRGHADVVSALIEAKADVHARNNEGKTGLILAGIFGHRAVAERLLEAGADVNARDATGATAVLCCANQGNDAEFLGTAKVLLKRGADTSIATHGGFTPVIAAISRGHSAMARLLLEHKATPLGCDSRTKLTALHAACQNGDMMVVADLIRAKADVNARDVERRLPLHSAVNCMHDAERVVLMCLQRAGNDVHAVDKDGLTALHHAAKNDLCKSAATLLDNGADVNARVASTGMTPLIYAASFNSPAAVVLLLQRGADINAKDKNGRTALASAASFAHTAVVAALRKAGAK